MHLQIHINTVKPRYKDIPKKTTTALTFEIPTYNRERPSKLSFCLSNILRNYPSKSSNLSTRWPRYQGLTV